MFNLFKHAQAQSSEQFVADMHEGLEEVEKSYGENEPAVTREEIKEQRRPENEQGVLEQKEQSVVANKLLELLANDFPDIANIVQSQPEIQQLLANQNEAALKAKIEEEGLTGLGVQLSMPGNQIISDTELQNYLRRIQRAYEEGQRQQDAVQQMNQNAFWGEMASSSKEIKTAQFMGQEPFVDEESKGRFIKTYLRSLIAYDGQKGKGDAASEQARQAIIGMVSPALENDTVDALEAIQQLSPTEADKASRFLGQVYDSFVSESAWKSLDQISNLEPNVMSKNTPKGIIKFNLNDHILNNKEDSLTKTASAFQSQEYILYGPSEKRKCPKLSGKKTGGGDIVSEYICRHHCLDGIVIDDNKTICGEALWRAHAMEKFNSEYVNADGEIVGGTLNKRFEINRNVPEETRMRLKPGETRKPRPASMGNLESRMQDMRNKEGEKRGYRPDTNAGQPFNWMTDPDQNNVEVSQKEKDRREKAMGHKTVDYSTKPPTENNPKVAEKIAGKFNLKHYKTAQAIPGGAPSAKSLPSESEMDLMGHADPMGAFNASVEEQLEQQGFYHIKDYQKWGRCPTYKNDKGEIRFVDQGKILDPQQMLELLKTTWQPQAQDEVIWKLNRMEQEFAALINSTTAKVEGSISKTAAIVENNDVKKVEVKEFPSDPAPEADKKGFNLKKHKTAKAMPDMMSVFADIKKAIIRGVDPRVILYHFKGSGLSKSEITNLIEQAKNELGQTQTVEAQLNDPFYPEPNSNAGNDYSSWPLSEVVGLLNDSMVKMALNKFPPETTLGQVWEQLDQATQQAITTAFEEGLQQQQKMEGYAQEPTPANQGISSFMSDTSKTEKIAEGVNTPLPEDGTPIEPKEEKIRKDDHHSRKISGKDKKASKTSICGRCGEEFEGIGYACPHCAKLDKKSFNLSHHKTAKEKGPFEYKGKKYETNPFAVCHKNVDKDEEPNKYERCTMHVKEKSKISTTNSKKKT